MNTTLRLKGRRAILALCLGLFTSAFSMGAHGADDEIVLGATVPITGPLVFSGQQYHYALQMAQDDINANGGINGKKLRIAFEDTQASNTVAVNAFIRLLREYDPPFIFLSSFTTQNLAIEPEVAKAQIPVMYAGGSEAVTDRNNKWMFRLRTDDSLLAKAMAHAAQTNFGKKPTGILYVQDDYGKGSANAIAELLQKGGSTVVGTEAYGARDNDFSAQLLSLKNKGAETYIMVGYSRDTALILQQRRNLGIKGDFVGGQAPGQPATLALLSAEDVNGVVAVYETIMGNDDASPQMKEYARRFKERFKIEADPFGSIYYDGAMIVADAMRKVGTDRTRIRDYLANLKDYPGLAHTYYADEKGNLSHSNVIFNFVPGTKEIKFQEIITR